MTIPTWAHPLTRYSWMDGWMDGLLHCWIVNDSPLPYVLLPQKKLGADTWYYAKRCILALIENLTKHMMMFEVGIISHHITHGMWVCGDMTCDM